jgi:hypothetical protein
LQRTEEISGKDLILTEKNVFQIDKCFELDFEKYRKQIALKEW